MVILLQILLEEFCDALEQVIACVCTVVDAVVAVGVDCCFELLVCLCQCVDVAYHVAQVNIVVGCAVNEQQFAIELVCIDNG